MTLDTIARQDRHTAIAEASEAIAAAGGYIIDHNLYSDLLAVLKLSLPAHRTGALARNLAERGLPVEPAPAEAMGTEEQDVTGSLSISFATGSGDLRRDVPAVDG